MDQNFLTHVSNSDLFPAELDDLRDGELARSKNMFRIALLIPMCGSAGLWAPSCISSAQVAVEELNRGNGIGGKEVQLIVIDAALEAAVPIEEVVNDLIETRSIDAIVGMHISAVRQRLSKVVKQQIPYIYTPLYEGGERTAGLYAIGETPHEQLGPSIKYVQRKFRPKSWALIGNDYIWPRTSHRYAKEKLRKTGVGLAYEEYVPFGLRSMVKLVEAIAASGADALLISLVGQDAVAFNRAFGAAGADKKIVRLSCAIEENGLLACGAKNTNRLFAASSYFSILPTEENAAFKERYYQVHGEKAPVLNTLGQSTYEGIHFLSGLIKDHAEVWRQHCGQNELPVIHKSGRSSKILGQNSRPPIFVARADGLTLSVEKKL